MAPVYTGIPHIKLPGPRHHTILDGRTHKARFTTTVSATCGSAPSFNSTSLSSTLLTLALPRRKNSTSTRGWSDFSVLGSEAPCETLCNGPLKRKSFGAPDSSGLGGYDARQPVLERSKASGEAASCKKATQMKKAGTCRVGGEPSYSDIFKRKASYSPKCVSPGSAFWRGYASNRVIARPGADSHFRIWQYARRHYSSFTKMPIILPRAADCFGLFEAP